MHSIKLVCALDHEANELTLNQVMHAVCLNRRPVCIFQLNVPETMDLVMNILALALNKASMKVKFQF